MPGIGASSASRCGGGNAATVRPPNSTESPSSSDSRRRRVAPCAIEMRWPISAQAAASYGLGNSTGRRPGNRRWRPATTGSRSPTAANPVPSTSSDSTRSTWRRISSSPSPPGSATTWPVRSAVTRTAIVDQAPSAGKTRSTTGSPPGGAANAGKDRWNRAAAASENGPRACIWNVTRRSNHAGTTA
jgi:hypothetical protein